MTSLNMVLVTATSSGLTTATTAYTSGDVLGAVMSWNLGTQYGLIMGGFVNDIADVLGPVDLMLYDRSVTLAADNAAPTTAPSDADSLFTIGQIEFPYPKDQGANRFSSIDSLALPVKANASTTIYGALITRSDHTFFAAATNIQVGLFFSKDT